VGTSIAIQIMLEVCQATQVIQEQVTTCLLCPFVPHIQFYFLLDFSAIFAAQGHLLQLRGVQKSDKGPKKTGGLG